MCSKFPSFVCQNGIIPYFKMWIPILWFHDIKHGKASAAFDIVQLIKQKEFAKLTYCGLCHVDIVKGYKSSECRSVLLKTVSFL